MTYLNKEQTEKLLEETTEMVKEFGQRPGQALFNCLETYAPEIAARIRCSNDDPFYNNKNIHNCLNSVLPIELWEEYIPLFVKLI